MPTNIYMHVFTKGNSLVLLKKIVRVEGNSQKMIEKVF